jgi:hypothetical protein
MAGTGIGTGAGAFACAVLPTPGQQFQQILFTQNNFC